MGKIKYDLRSFLKIFWHNDFLQLCHWLPVTEMQPALLRSEGLSEEHSRSNSCKSPIASLARSLQYTYTRGTLPVAGGECKEDPCSISLLQSALRPAEISASTSDVKSELERWD